MFKERMKIIGKRIGFALAMFVFTIVLFAAWLWVGNLIDKHVIQLDKLVTYLFIFFFTVLACMLLWKVWEFIRWIAVEPFIDYRKKSRGLIDIEKGDGAREVRAGDRRAN